MELLIMIDALRRASAKTINCIVPYFGYARSDKKDQPRVAITAKLVANLLTTAGADRVVALDLHSSQIQGFFDIPVDHLSALPLFARYFRKNLDISNLVVVSPDAGGTYRARELSKRLNCPLAIGDKRRVGNDDNAEILNIIGDVKGKDVLIFDDILDTAGSITRLSKALKKHGANKIYAACVHGVLSGNAMQKLQNSNIEKVFITDSIPHENCDCKKLVEITIAELLAMAIKKIHIGESLSILFR
jgi:ribose-phosphate pyrophosphokinase